MKSAIALSIVVLAALTIAAVPATSPDANLRSLGTPRGERLTGVALDAKTEAVASLLRCPVCQGLSIADSPSPMAVNMKRQTHELLAAGYDEEQVLAYFERSYGEFVRLQPPLRGVNWLVWLAPLLLLIGGASLLARRIRSSRASASAESDLPARDALPSDEKLARHVLRVRELAYGWPGGRRPREEND